MFFAGRSIKKVLRIKINKKIIEKKIFIAKIIFANVIVKHLLQNFFHGFHEAHWKRLHLHRRPIFPRTGLRMK
jgi:hypothetical protein